MKKLTAFLVVLLSVPYGLWAQTGQFKAIATSPTTFTWYFIPSADFTSSGNLTFDVTMEIDNGAGCAGGQTTAPVLAISNNIYGNATSRSTAAGTSSSGGTKTAVGVTPAFWNQRYIFAAVSTAGTLFTAGQLYPLATFTLPGTVPSVNCVKILDWNNDRIGNGVSTGAVNGDTHISINGIPTALVDNNTALFVRATTTNGYIIPDITNGTVTTATSYMPLGWDEKPIANPVTQTLATQPASDQIITLNGGANPPAQNGTDVEDGTLGGTTQTSKVVITQLPTNGELYYNGVLVTVGQEIPNFDASLISVKLTGTGYTSTTFMYAFKDSKDFQSDPAAYTLDWALPLPVTLVSFSVQKEGNISLLNWVTTEEINADRFDIQRSANAKTWNTIGSKSATGESKVTISYSFTDIAPLSGANYYRLKMIDNDDTFAYSRIQSVQFGEGASISVYPNPVSNVIFLKDIDLAKIKEVSIINMSGITQYKATSVSANGINVKNLSNGIYIVKVTQADGALSTHKIVVNK